MQWSDSKVGHPVHNKDNINLLRQTNKHITNNIICNQFKILFYIAS